ncbi:diacylglycerol/lipid kinase family protein [Propionicimonas sp.]|uniref:diacylglycerol/lipid kinase family protein n=1 Tax=Propionicimonas sp. TaxID=1955623 RepID=UPI0039E5C034
MDAASRPAPGSWAVVVNPSKFDDLARVRDDVARLCDVHDWPRPTWYETTVEDPGEGQAREAVDAGAELVCPLGGDGTVRAVASGLLGSELPMGLLPGGTGNLLARNLSLPLDDLDAALTVAMTGADLAVDVGEVAWDGAEPAVFLVAAGMGLDAEMMAGVDARLKKRVGWLAYALSGASALFRLGFGVRVAADRRRAVSQHARTVMVANCGELAGGLSLIPDARVDDGLLDTILATPRSIAAWFAIALHVLSVHRRGHPALVHLTSERVDIVTKEPVEAQLDGDAIGRRTRMTCSVRPAALTVRVVAREPE